MPPSLADWRHRAILALAVVASLAFYLALVAPGMHGPFVFDDFPNLGGLAGIGSHPTWREIGIYLSQSQFFPGRPLAMLSFLPQHADWPARPLPFKAVNLALHVVNATLLYALLRTLAKRAVNEPSARWLAFLVAFAWLAHPMQLSTVFLVIQRMTLLATMFVLLGLLAYCRGLLGEGLSEARRAMWMGAGLVGGTVLGVLCKESAILLPVYAWVLDATLLRPERDRLPGRLRQWRALLIYTAVGALFAFLAYQVRTLADPIGTRDFTLLERLLTQPRVLVDYLANTLLPRYAVYGVYHDDFVTSRGLLSPLSTLPALLGLVAATVLAVAWRRRFTVAAFATLWFVGGHLLEAGPLPLEIYFEHRHYLPMAGVLFGLGVGVHRLCATPVRGAVTLLVGAWLLAMFLATALYARVWSDNDKLWYFWAAQHPDSPRSQAAYAEVLFGHDMGGSARKLIAASALRSPREPSLHAMLLFIDCSLGTADRAAVAALARRLHSAPYTLQTEQMLGELRKQASARTCPKALDDAAWLTLSDALLANPAYAMRRPRAHLHYQRHELALARGQLDTAMAELDRTYVDNPDPDVVRLQARYLQDAGLADEAIALLRAYDGRRRPLLRRLLVDDEAINREAIETIRARRSRPGAANDGPAASPRAAAPTLPPPASLPTRTTIR
jgi:hypothetical protein